MGASLDIQGGNIVGEAPSGLKGAYVYLDFPSVGATENIMIAGALAVEKPQLRTQLRISKLLS